ETQVSEENDIEPLQKTEKTKIDPINKIDVEFSEQEIADFGLNYALDYFQSEDDFDDEGVEVDRIIHINVDKACGGPDKLVLLKKNDLYAGYTQVDIDKQNLIFGSTSPGNYSDKNFDGVHIEKPYISLEEAIEQVSQLKEGLIFKDYMNTCFDGKIGSYSHMPYFRFVDEKGEEFLYNIDGEYKQLINHKNLKKKMAEILAESEDPKWDKAEYTPDELNEYFNSDIPEKRLKVISSNDSEKIYQLVFDTDPEVQRSAFLEIMDHTRPNGNLYLEDFYTDLLSANLSYETLLELQGFDFEKFNLLSKKDFINTLKESSSFALLTERQKNEILRNF
ncbi:MAG: hypothetical protein ACPHY8_00865, partial [Patescibacteria group bacterium]